MARSIMDDGLKTWEAFANTGRYGFAAAAEIVFQCTSDPWERPRAHTLEGDKSDAETLVASAPAARLKQLLEGAKPLQ